MTMQVTTYFEIAFSFGNKLDLIFRMELLLADGSYVISSIIISKSSKIICKYCLQ